MRTLQRTTSWTRTIHITFLLILCVPLPNCVFVHAGKAARQFVLVFDKEDGKQGLTESGLSGESGSEDGQESSDWDEFGELEDSEEEDLDPGSWRSVVGDHPGGGNISAADDTSYRSGVQKMLYAVSAGEPEFLEAAIRDLEQAADQGNAHAQSTLAFLYGSGCGVQHSNAKAFLFHHFAAEGGDFQSKMALAYSYLRLQINEESVKLYAELAATAVASFLSSKESSLIEPVRLNDGLEENKQALRKSRGEEDDDFQILEYQARKGNAGAMYRVGVFYYFGLRGVQRDHSKALFWFSKAVEKGDSTSMELLGEIYSRGIGVERNFTKALEWFESASRHNHFSAFNGIGYLYVKGHGIGKRNYTMAKEFFKMAAEHADPNGHYNLGVLYLNGKGTRKNVDAASKHFVIAANAGHAKAYYQLAKLFQKGIGVKKDLVMAATLYKIVAERGPWGSLLRWALESYLKGDVGKSLLLYSRAAELGYEVAQSNAAWILEKYQEEEFCIGKSGFCTVAERHQRAHTLWWHASEQGNDDAALLIGDAYYYGHGTEKDLERAAEAYKHARSQANAQAIFNLGYMHEHGIGLPLDLHLAKRYYDEALQTDPAATLPVTLALVSLWLRQHYGDSFLVRMIDSLPDLPAKIINQSREVIFDEGNATLVTLFICLMTVLYLRQRQRRIATHAIPPPQPQ
eukprot:c28701_g1_i2 orf=217-2274(+)